jgi:hypothetical protein
MKQILVQNIDDFAKLNKNNMIALNPKHKDFKKQLQLAYYYNFQTPFIHHNNYNNYNNHNKIKNPYLLLSKEKNEEKEYNNFLKKINFTIKNYKYNTNTTCSNYIILTKHAIDFLYKNTFDSNGGSQKEISGIFDLYPISDNTLSIEIDEKSVSTGETESVKHNETVGSFHTHPFDAYVRYNVCIAFPSADDYFTTLYIYASGYGSFHVTSTMEGLYVITIKKSFMKEKRKKILENFEKYKEDIEDTYGMDYPNCDPNGDNMSFWKKYLKEYINSINKLKYFNVQFIFWKDALKPINITYKRIKNNCLISDKQIDVYKKL